VQTYTTDKLLARQVTAYKLHCSIDKLSAPKLVAYFYMNN